MFPVLDKDVPSGLAQLAWVAKYDLFNVEVVDKALKASAVQENPYIESWNS